MSLEEEVSFLEQFKSKAEKGRILISRDIHKSYAEKIGKSIDKTITYRLLHRHGWRKIAPRPEHPNTYTAAARSSRIQKLAKNKTPAKIF